MMIKITILVLGATNGLWMVFDGVHVLLKGKYFGPEKPGPWSDLVALTGLNPFKLGPVFVFLGMAWLVFLFAVLTGAKWGWPLGVSICVATLWYLPFGTLISIVVFVLLILFRANFTQ